MTFRVAIRADASDRIGGGHVGRCLALAQVLRGWGCEVRFIGRDRPGFPADRVRRAGFDLRLVGDGEGDLTAPVDLLVVDAYHLDRVWESVQRPRAAAIAVIDDLADRPHDGDWLIDAGRPDGSAYVGLTEAPVLAGPRFALLRREFEAARRRQDDTDGVPEGDGRLVLFFGAADRSGLSAVALDALSLLGADAPPADLVVTSANPRAEALAARAAAMPGVCLHRDVDDMAAILAGATLAVTGGGVALWERCCLGLPGLVVTQADNQAGNVALALAAGAARVLGRPAEITPVVLAEAIRDLMDDGATRAAMARAARCLVDGRGARRVAAHLLPLDLAPANENDTDLLWTWANDPAVRGNAFSSEPIPLDVHRAWMGRKLADPHCRILIAREGGQAVGQVRFDLRGGRAEIDISIDPARRGAGLGTRMLIRAVEALRAGGADAVPEALVKAGNRASRAMFLNAGFRRAASPRPDAERFVLEAA